MIARRRNAKRRKPVEAPPPAAVLELARKLRPVVCSHSTIDPDTVALGVAQLVYDGLERGLPDEYRRQP